MNIVNTLTLRHIKTHKKRSVLTILAIIVSVAMVTAVFTSALSFVKYFQNISKAIDGEWHAEFDVSDYADKIDEFQKDENISQFGAATYYDNYFLNDDIEFTEDDSFYSESEDIYAVDKSYLDIKNVKINQGEMPKSVNEILVSQDYIKENDLDWKIGDTVTLYNVTGERQIVQHQFKITGITESRVSETDYHSLWTGYNPSEFPADEITSVYVRYDKLNNGIWDKIMATAEAVDAQYDIEPLYNDELFAYSGIMKNNTVLASLGGFCGIILVIIAIVSIFMIYDSFAVSYQERARYLGMLASVGATKKQKRSSIYFEGLVLGAIGIPLGIIAGIGGIGITFKAIGEIWIDTLAVEYDKTLELCVNWVVILATVIASALTIFVSSYIPARKASKTTAIDAIRQTDTVKVKNSKRLKTSKLAAKLFGYEATLAVKNFKRNGRRSRTIVFALFMSVVVFLSVTNFSMMFSDVMTTSYAGYGDLFITVSGNDIPATESVIKDTKGIDSYYGSIFVNATADSDYLSQEAKELEYDSCETVFVFMDNASLDNYLKELGESTEKYHDLKHPTAIVHNKSLIVEDSKKKTIAPLKDLTGKEISATAYTYEDYADKEKEVIVSLNTTVGISTDKDWSNETFSIQKGYSPIVILSIDHLIGYVDDLSNYNYEFTISCDDSEAVNKSITDVLNEKNINYTSFDASSEMQAVNNILTIAKVFIYGFIILITLISIMNIINTISNSMNERRREFAMIRSVGMTPKSFVKMIYYESFRYGFKALLFALPVSVAIHYGMYRALANSFDYGFQFHPTSYIIAFVAVFIIIGIALLYSFGKIKDDNIIETLKQDY